VSDHNAIKLELNNKRSSKKYANIWRLKNTLCNNHWVIEEIGKKSESYWNLMKISTQPIRIYGTGQRKCKKGSL
jgi:hypothetical protein